MKRLFCRLFHWPWHVVVVTKSGDSNSSKVYISKHYKCKLCNRCWSNMEKLSMEAYHNGDSQPLRDVIDALEDENKP